MQRSSVGCSEGVYFFSFTDRWPLLTPLYSSYTGVIVTQTAVVKILSRLRNSNLLWRCLGPGLLKGLEELAAPVDLVVEGLLLLLLLLLLHGVNILQQAEEILQKRAFWPELCWKVTWWSNFAHNAFFSSEFSAKYSPITCSFSSILFRLIVSMMR